MKAAAHSMSTPHLDLFEALELYARLGFDGVEVLYTAGYPCALHPGEAAAEVPRLKRLARELGLEIAQITPYAKDFDSADRAERQAAVEEIRLCMELASELECGNIRIWAGNEPPGGVEADQFDRLVSTLRELSAEASSMGVGLNIENHIGSQAVTSAGTVRIVEAVGAGIGITYDPGNLLMLGESDAVGALLAQLPYVRHVHFKDLKVLGERKHLPAVIGEGEVPWADLMPVLVEHDFQGYFSTEFEKRWHPELLPDSEAGLTHELNSLRDLWNAAAR